MTETTILSPFALEGLLILFLQCEEQRLRGLKVLLNKRVVPKPLFGIKLPEGGGYVLVADIENFPPSETVTLEVIDSSDKGIAVVTDKPLLPVGENDIRFLSSKSRARLWDGFLNRLPIKFPRLRGQVIHNIASALAVSNVVAVKVSPRGTYFRLPHAPMETKQIRAAKLFRMTSEGVQPLEDMSVLSDQGWIHGVMASGGDDPISLTGTFILYVADQGPIPFTIGSSRRNRRYESALKALLTTFPGDAEALKDFIRCRQTGRTGIDASEYAGASDGLRGKFLVGWAHRKNAADDPVRLDIYVDGAFFKATTANVRRRPAALTKSGEHCGFRCALDDSLLDGKNREIKICYAGTSAEIANSPVTVGVGHYDGDLLITSDGRLQGWVRERRAKALPADVEIRIDDQALAVEKADRYSEALAEMNVPQPNFGFAVELPDQVFDGEQHCITVSIVKGADRIELGKTVRFEARYIGRFETLTPYRVAGFIFNQAAPLRPVDLDLVVNGKVVATGTARMTPVEDAAQNGRKRQRPVFDFEIPKSCRAESGISVSLFISGTQTQVLGPKVVITPSDLAMRLLMTAAEALNSQGGDGAFSSYRISGGLGINEDLSFWFRSRFIAGALAEIRKHKTFPESITIPLSPIFRYPHRTQKSDIIDVIIPVYKGFQQTVECIESALRTKSANSYELIVINDRSPDPQLTDKLRDMAGRGAFTLLENDENLGFVRTVNRAMRLHPDRDVVLLNSDTVVPTGWLDRLNGAAYSQANIGTVTPFSNNATICSFPKPCADNVLPDGVSLASVDHAFKKTNHGQTVDLPTAIGFCMYIKRDVLDETGYFDEKNWGHGYGEENDFCLRASALGWRHVAACDLFVLHHGSVSFGENSGSLISKNLGKLNELYPDYANTVQRFIGQDPLRNARNNAAKELLSAQAKEFMLFVTHSLGGGTQVAIDDMSERLKEENISVLQLMAKPGNRWQLSCFGLPFTVNYTYHEDWDRLVRDLKHLGVWHIHYHQTMHFPSEIWSLAEILGVRYDFTAHDYLAICPRINMIDESGAYCADSSLSVDTCNRCIAMNGPEPGLEGKFSEFGGNVAGWRNRYLRYLTEARRVFFPSEDTANRYKRYFDLKNNLFVKPHPEPVREILPREPVLYDQAYSIAVIGAIGPHKGYDLLLSCARSAQKEGLPLRFVVIGYTCKDVELLEQSNVIITGKYDKNQLSDLIEKHGCTISLFLSPWPETYSYTLSEALRSGLYPIALDMGAISERIRRMGFGQVVPATYTAKQVNQFILNSINNWTIPTTQLTNGQDYESICCDYYGFGEMQVLDQYQLLS